VLHRGGVHYSQRAFSSLSSSVRTHDFEMPVPRKQRTATMGRSYCSMTSLPRPSLGGTAAMSPTTITSLRKNLAPRSTINYHRKEAIISPIKRPQQNSREGKVCSTLVPPVIIKLKKQEPVTKYRGRKTKNRKVSSLDRAARASRRLEVLKDLLKLKILSSNVNRSLSRQDYHTFGKAFKRMDTNGDGVVDYAELEEALGPNGMNIGLREGEVEGLAREFDVDGNGSIDIEEFFHTLADLDRPNEPLPNLLVQTKKRELNVYMKKMEDAKEAMKDKYISTPIEQTTGVDKTRKKITKGGVEVTFASQKKQVPPTMTTMFFTSDKVDFAESTTNQASFSGTNKVSPNVGALPKVRSLPSSPTAEYKLRETLLPLSTPTTSGGVVEKMSASQANAAKISRRKIMQKSASLPTLSGEKLLGTCRFVTGEGPSSTHDLRHLKYRKNERLVTEKKVWPADRSAVSVAHTPMSFYAPEPGLAELKRDIFCGSWTGQRMFHHTSDFDSQFKIESPGAPKTMKSWKCATPDHWEKAKESKRKGAEVYVPILAKRYAKRDDEAFRQYNCRLNGRVQSRYNYMIGFFENEAALAKQAQRGNKKGGLHSSIARMQQRGQGIF
jgi:hypothetical protein